MNHNVARCIYSLVGLLSFLTHLLVCHVLSRLPHMDKHCKLLLYSIIGEGQKSKSSITQ